MTYGLSQKEIDAIRGVFETHPKLDEVILYGSRAKGNYRPASDVDLTMLGEALDYQELAKIENELDDLLLPYSIDLSIYHLIENSDLVDHIKRVGKTFYACKR